MENINITIQRQLSGTQGIIGYLLVNNQPVAHTLELPWKENQKQISSIPEGSYNGFLRYDKTDKWRIELTNVPGRSHIQIHIGNTTQDIEGCVLVGLRTDVGSFTVHDSTKAYEKLKEAFYGSSDPDFSPDKNITIDFIKTY